MNTEKLERANILAKSLIPKVNELLNMSPKSCGKTQTNVFPIYRENYEHLFLIGERIKLDYEISKI